MADNITNNQSTGNGTDAPAAAQPVNNQAAMTPEALAEAFSKALNTRTDRAEAA